jgi:hypothetical protein
MRTRFIKTQVNTSDRQIGVFALSSNKLPT